MCDLIALAISSDLSLDRLVVRLNHSFQRLYHVEKVWSFVVILLILHKYLHYLIIIINRRIHIGYLICCYLTVSVCGVFPNSL